MVITMNNRFGLSLQCSICMGTGVHYTLYSLKGASGSPDLTSGGLAIRRIDTFPGGSKQGLKCERTEGDPCKTQA